MGALLLAGWAMLGSALAFDASLERTLPGVVSEDHGVVYVGDIDGDSELDLVVRAGRQLRVLEEGADGFDTLWSRGGTWRGVAVGDADGDGLPEIIGGDYWRVRVFEADGDDAIGHRHTQHVGWAVERSAIGDTDGDGLGEWMIAREGGSATRLRVVEARGDDDFADAGWLAAGGAGGRGNGNVVPSLDFDDDGRVETVFAYDGFGGRARLRVYEEGTRTWSDDQLDLWPLQVGDTDGDGLGELLGVWRQDWDRVMVAEATGTGDAFEVVMDLPRDGLAREARDLDGDGVLEFARYTAGGGDSLDVLAIAHREGDALSGDWDSGTALSGYGDLRWIDALGDPDDDGQAEFAVVQGTSVHVFQVGIACGPEPLLEAVADLPGPGRSLRAKAERAVAAWERGSLRASEGLLEALGHEVDAQRGRHLTSGQADAIERGIDLLRACW